MVPIGNGHSWIDGGVDERCVGCWAQCWPAGRGCPSGGGGGGGGRVSRGENDGNVERKSNRQLTVLEQAKMVFASNWGFDGPVICSGACRLIGFMTVSNRL